MRKNILFRFKLLFLAISLINIWGCDTQTKPEQYHKFESFFKYMSEPCRQKFDSNVKIGIVPIVFPDYLRQPNIVSRTNSNKLTFAKFDQWEGSFKENFEIVLAENISALTGIHPIYIYPWPKTVPINIQTIIHVLEFDGTLGKYVTLKVKWGFREDKRYNLLINSTFREPTGGDTYGDFVTAQNRVLNNLSREIAIRLKDFLQSNTIKKSIKDSETAGIDYSGQNRNKADFSGTDLSGANLCGANFSEAQLEKADLK